MSPRFSISVSAQVADVEQAHWVAPGRGDDRFHDHIDGGADAQGAADRVGDLAQDAPALPLGKIVQPLPVLVPRRKRAGQTRTGGGQGRIGRC